MLWVRWSRPLVLGPCLSHCNWNAHRGGPSTEKVKQVPREPGAITLGPGAPSHSTGKPRPLSTRQLPWMEVERTLWGGFQKAASSHGGPVFPTYLCLASVADAEGEWRIQEAGCSQIRTLRQSQGRVGFPATSPTPPHSSFLSGHSP